MLALALAGAIAALATADAAAQTNDSSGGFFGGLFGHSSTPAPPPSDPNIADPLRLENQKKPGVELYVAVAHLYIQTGKFAEAEDQFRLARRKSPPTTFAFNWAMRCSRTRSTSRTRR